MRFFSLPQRMVFGWMGTLDQCYSGAGRSWVKAHFFGRGCSHDILGFRISNISDILGSEIFAALKIYFGVSNFNTWQFAVIGVIRRGERAKNIIDIAFQKIWVIIRHLYAKGVVFFNPGYRLEHFFGDRAKFSYPYFCSKNFQTPYFLAQNFHTP